jgi:hypothetical protein
MKLKRFIFLIWLLIPIISFGQSKKEPQYPPGLNDTNVYYLPDDYSSYKQFSINSNLSIDYNTWKKEKSKLKSCLGSSNPTYEFDYSLEDTLPNTYFKIFNYYEWELPDTVTFETVREDSLASDPVMFFLHELPSNLSEVNDDGGKGYQSKITAIITEPGEYYLLVIAYGSTGNSALYKDGEEYESNITFTPCYESNTQAWGNDTLNFFTAYLEAGADPWLFIQNRGDFGSHMGEIIDHNDDNLVSSDYNWGYNSRLRDVYEDYNYDYVRCIFVPRSASSVGKQCDLYMGVKAYSYIGSTKSYSGDPDEMYSLATSQYTYNCLEVSR